MRSFKEFVTEALKGSGVQNDSLYVWVCVDGEQYTVDRMDVIDTIESYPFEASYNLEEDLLHPAWQDLYSQYVSEQEYLEEEGYDGV